MRTDTPHPVRLVDYAPPTYLVDEAWLSFDLRPTRTEVRSTLLVRRNGPAPAPFVLNGVGLALIAVSLDGEALGAEAYRVGEEDLTILGPPERFRLEIVVQINPEANEALEGLYMSGGRFCTQCEAEGFRKITYFPDRPDVLARFTVTLEADEGFERLLSNGNLVESGRREDGRRFAVWNDPFPKPCYLFALVAGELDVLEDRRTTSSGRLVELKIYVDPGQSRRALYAMDALKRSMAWDETAFGREYDLDLFMIVAVRDFNFGAMENKGLNIFNSSLLLADAETATDADYERIESVVAHEYFHNWTGDRITCRDWFQLCLKEGLTVFRDQEFSGEMRGQAVQRIKDVKVLRARQFAEDAGPLAHPVRPTSYLKIDNFYTATIYEKGAEIIRMLKILIGADAFAAGLNLYFDRWDGQAATVEAFIACFAESSRRDLTDFFTWYEQVGTPQVRLDSVWNETDETMTLTFTQTPAEAAGAAAKTVPIPVVLGLLDDEGRELAGSELVVLDQESLTLVRPAPRRAVVSAFRGFSAPVIVSSDAPEKDLYLLMAADEDLFNRWDAGQTLGRRLILRRSEGLPDDVGEERYAEAAGRALADQGADEAFKALMLTLPSENDLALARSPADPLTLRDAREALRARLARHLESVLFRLHANLHDAAPFAPDAAGAGRRALRNAALDLLCAEPGADVAARARGHYFGAANMTEAMGGLNALMLLGGPVFEEALGHFYERWRSEPLVLDKWFAVQARSPDPGVLGRVIGLTAHPDFDAKTPNRLRALVQTFASANPARFHDPSGAGYRFLADQILLVDAFNPMTAARLLEPLGSWRRYRQDLGAGMRDALVRILDHAGTSKNVLELAAKALES